MSRIGHTTRRHPLCPACRYDLVATLDAGGRVCPECGAAFAPEDLVRARAPGDWTLAGGLRRLAAALAVRSVIWAAAFLLVAWGAHALIGAAASGSWALRMAALLGGGLAVIATGGSLGAFIGRNAEEHAGFSGGVLIGILIGWCTLVVVATLVTAQALGIMTATGATMIGTSIVALAGLFVIRQALMEAC